MRALGSAVHALWKTLSRQVHPTVLAHPDRHSLLPLPHPFIIPGDRFRECYNWDSYWIIRGLLASGLLPAAEHLVRNLLYLVDRLGFVPNGARSYYTNRSQPPLLSAMALAVWNVSADDALLVDVLPRLVVLHSYWTSGSKAVRVRAGGAQPGGCEAASGAEDVRSGALGGAAPGQAAEVFELSRYHAELYGPRPESYREDVQLVADAGISEHQASALCCDIASAAESGWDFSSRWFVGGDSLQYTRTTQIVPADLNAWLYRTERDIAAIAAQVGDTQLRDTYSGLAAQRLRAINQLMWSASDGCWHDLLIRSPEPADGSDNPAPHETIDAQASAYGAAPRQESTASAGPPRCDTRVDGEPPGPGASGVPLAKAQEYEAQQRSGVYASNWVPLWCGCAEPGGAQAAAAVAGLLSSGLVQEGGLLTSLYASGQQWDAPNAWPPLVHMTIEALSESGVPGAQAAGAQLAHTWLRANLTAWNATGHMHEKHNGYVLGGVGDGGEYKPQVGFGWSNGVVMALLQRYCCSDAHDE